MLKNLWNALKMVGLAVCYQVAMTIFNAVDAIALFILSGIGLVFAAIDAAKDGLDLETMNESYFDFLADGMVAIGTWLNQWGTECKRQRLEEIWAKEEAKNKPNEDEA